MPDERITGPHFDVYLCYNPLDILAIRAINTQLKQKGLSPWLDEEQLPPGTLRRQALEIILEQTKIAAFFVGRNATEPWQELEVTALLDALVKRGCRLIPVLLEDASGEPQVLPLFLRGLTWVDFRQPDPDPISQLVWGITHERADAAARLRETLARFEERYLTALQQDQAITSFKVLDMHSPLKIADTYIRLQVHTEMMPPRSRSPESTDPLHIQQQQERWLDVQARTALDPLAALRKFRHCVILGNPGAGKTTLLKYLTLHLAQHELSALPRLPVYVRLNAFASSGESDLLKFAAQSWEKNYGIPTAVGYAAILEQLKQDNVLLLLDALDETAIGETAEQAEDVYQRVANEVDHLANDCSWIVVTARKADYQHRKLRAFTELELLDFRQQEIEQFIDAWFLHHSSPERHGYAFSLKNALQNKPRMRSLAANPLLLTLIVLRYERFQALPEQRSELYRDCAELLLGHWDADYHRTAVRRYRLLSTLQQKQLLQTIAWHFHAQGLRDFPKDQVLSIIGAFLPKVQKQNIAPEEVLDYISGDTGLLRAQGADLYAFLHLTFQEFFASQYVSDVSLLLPHLADPWWEEVLVLYAGEARDASPLLEYLLASSSSVLPFPVIAEDIFASKLLLAGRCLVAHPPLDRPQLWADALTLIFKQLQSSTYTLTRLHSAETLAEIGNAYLGDDVDVNPRLLQLLRKGTSTSDLAMKRCIASALGDYGAQELAADLLELLVTHGSELADGVYTSIAQAIAKLADHSLLPRLLALLDDTTTDLRLALSVANFIGRAGDAATARLLLSKISDPHVDLYLRSTLAFSIGILGDSTTLSSLLALITQPQTADFLAPAILVALVQRQYTIAAPILLPLLVQAQIPLTTRGAIASILPAIGDDTLVAQLRPLLSNRALEIEVRLLCAEALTQFVLHTQRDVVLSLLAAPDLEPALRAQVALTLALSGDTSFLLDLPGFLLREPVSIVKFALRSALALLGYYPEISWLREQFIASNLAAALYTSAADTIVRYSSSADLHTILMTPPSQFSSEKKVALQWRRIELVEAIGRADNPALIDLLFTVLSTAAAVPDLRNSAAQAIGRLGYNQATVARLLTLWRSYKLQDLQRASVLVHTLYRALWLVCRKARVTIVASGPGGSEYTVVDC